MTTRAFNSLPEVAARLEELVRQKATGTLFLGTRTHRWAQLALNAGQICFVQCGGKRGKAAVVLLAAEQELCCSFKDKLLTGLRDALPSTAWILKQLGGADQPGITPETTNGPEADAQWQQVEQLLTRYIGPVAQLYCQRIFSQSPELSWAIRQLAQEIPSPRDAQEFLHKAQAWV